MSHLGLTISQTDNMARPEQAAARFREALTHVVQLEQVSLPDLVELRTAIETAALARAAATQLRQHLGFYAT